MSDKNANDEVQQLRARIATLEQLLDVHEQTVAQQSDRLEGAITDLREHARQLSQSEQTLLKQRTILQSILDNMADGVVVADENGKLVIVNPAAEQIIRIGVTDTVPEEWSRHYGLYLPDRVTPVPTNELPLMQAIRGEEVDEQEVFMRHGKAPEGIWISVTARPLKDHAGGLKGGLAVFRDVTERKRAERRLTAQHATTRVLAESLTLDEATPKIIQAICESLGWEMGAIWRADRHDNLLHCVEVWHEPAVDISRFEAGTREITFSPGVGLPGRVWKSGQPAWIADVTRDTNFPRAPIALEVGLHGAFGFPILLKDEVVGVIEFFSREIRDPDDNLLRMMATIGSQIGQFIDRKDTEAQLLKLSRAVEQSANLVVITDRDGAIEYVNPKFTEVSGYSRADVVGKNPRIVKSGRTSREEYQRLWNTITSGGVWTGDFLNKKKNGEFYWVSASISPVRNLQGEITHFLAVQQDVTELKRAEEALRESEQRLQSILDNATAVIYVKDRAGKYILINRQYERLFHVTRAQMVGTTDYEFFPREAADAFRANDLKVLAAGRPLEFDEVVPQDDGMHSYLSIKFPLFDADGTVYAVCGISTDITDRKQIEDALKHERYLLHSLMNNVPDAIYFKDAQSRFTRINRSLAEKNGLSDPSQAIGKSDFDFFTKEHARQAFEDEQELMRTGRPLIGKEEKETWPDGSATWVLTTKLPLRAVDDKIVGTFGISRDITKRKEMELALRDSEALYHSLVESLPLNVFRKDLDGRLTFANSMYQKTLGKPLRELHGKTDHDLFPKELADKYVADDHRVRELGGVFETIEEHQKPDGERLFVQVLKTPVYDAAGAVVGTQVIFWDVTERHRAEEALHNSERRYRQFTQGSQDAIVVANQHGLITLFNVAAQKTFGYTEAEVLGQPVTILMPREFHEAHTLGFSRFLATQEPRVVGKTVELRGRRKNGEIFHLDLSLTALDLPEGISFLAAIRDTTDRHRNAEERARMHARVAHAERLASVGLLSAGVAHEINNPLAFIANNLVVLDRDFNGIKSLLDMVDAAGDSIQSACPDLAARIAAVAEEIDLKYVRENLQRVLDSTRQGVKRVADIVQNLRAYARTDQAATDRVDIHDALATSLEMIQGRLTRRKIAVVQHYGTVPHVSCAPAQLNQVFLNLLVNAMQAIEAASRPSGTIEISTHARDNHVLVEIADDGCGIPADVIPKIFDPFFTTKPVGEGTGLGLSITHGIVRDHKGEIEVESTPGVGTRFRVILPIDGAPKTSA